MRKYIPYLIIILSFFLATCTVTKKVRDGDSAYLLKQYAVAIPMLEEEYDKTQVKEEKGRKAYYLGNAYDILNEYDKAIKWYAAADRQAYSSSTKLWLANAYKKNEQYVDAAKLYEQLYRETNTRRYLSEVELCNRAIYQKKNSKNYNINSFSINTKYGEYSPVYLDDENLVFTSDRDASQGKDTYNWTGNAFSDLYVANIKGRKVNNFDAMINTAANEGTACFSQDGSQIFFTRCESINLRDQHCRIYFSHRPNGFWMEAEPLMFFDEKTNFAHPCLIENDSILVFSAAPSGGDGTYDLYYSERVEEGWSEPELMPSSINSQGNEKFPTSYKDTLFFSSDYLPGYGGYDIFYTVLDKTGTWSSPVNMDIPINSGGDDLGLAIDPKFPKNRGILLQGYFSSSRNVGTGDDLFFFTKYVPTEEETDDEPIVEDTKIYNTYLSVRVVEIKYKDDDPNKAIIDKVPIAGAELSLRSDDPDIDTQTDKRGRYTAQIIPAGSIEMLASKDGFIANKKTVFPEVSGSTKGDTTINVELALDRIQYDKEIVLQSIYYDYNRSDIRKDAKPSLDTLKNLLDLNPTLRIQLASHTDCRGELAYNLKLSQKRAESAVRYLASAGIEKTRMVALGYGLSQPIENCSCDTCSEEEHQRNRRTTFKILKN